MNMRPSAVLTRALERLGPEGCYVVRGWVHTSEDDDGRETMDYRNRDGRSRHYCILGAIWAEGAQNSGPERMYLNAAANERAMSGLVYDFREDGAPWESIVKVFAVAIGMAHADEEAAAVKEPAHVS